MSLSALERIQSSRVLVIAHRGNSRHAPENTLPAFQSAAKLGVDFLELDYRHTADDVPVVFHDQFLDRTTDAARHWPGIRIPLDSKTAAEVRTLDAGRWFSPEFEGTRLSTLADLLAELPDSCFMIERKSGSAEVCVRLLEQARATDRVIVQAFDWDFLRDCRARSPRIVLGALGSKQLTDEHIRQAGALGAAVMGWEAASLDAETIARVHAAGLRVWAWTVDELELAERLLAAGVDGLISNCPADIQALLAQRAAAAD